MIPKFKHFISESKKKSTKFNATQQDLWNCFEGVLELEDYQDKALKLGQEFFDLQKLSDGARRSMWKVSEILWNEVDESLRKLYTDIPPKIIPIRIGEKEYYMESDMQYNYARFKMVGEKSDKVIII